MLRRSQEVITPSECNSASRKSFREVLRTDSQPDSQTLRQRALFCPNLPTPDGQTLKRPRKKRKTTETKPGAAPLFVSNKLSQVLNNHPHILKTKVAKQRTHFGRMSSPTYSMTISRCMIVALAKRPFPWISLAPTRTRAFRFSRIERYCIATGMCTMASALWLVEPPLAGSSWRK